MIHKISITTVDALIINKALRNDLGNEVDNIIAEEIIQKINVAVAKDLKKKKSTDLTDKCGSCKWQSQEKRIV